MKILLTTVFRKLAFLILITLSCIQVKAQNYTIIGNGTSSNTNTSVPSTFGNYNWGFKNQYFIKASELTSYGLTPGAMINSIGFYVVSTNSIAPLNGWNIKVYTTSATNPLSANLLTTGKVSYSTATTLIVDTGWNQTTLTHPFIWNSGENLVIETCFNNDSSSFNASVQRTNSGLSGATFTRYIRGNNTSICDDYTSAGTSSTSQRVNIRLGYAPTACSGSPTAGTAYTSIAHPCVNDNVELGINGLSNANNIAVQWQEATASGGPWTNTTNANNIGYFFVANTTKYYRASVTCSGNTTYTNTILVTVDPYLAAGTYTINSALPTSGNNFHSFADFASAIQYAISGPVIVNVTNATYNEKLKLGEICGTSATNTITINGNGATLAYTSTNTNSRGVITLDGTKNVIINNLNVNAYNTSNSNYAWGVLLTNGASNDSIKNCTITLDSNTSSANYAGIVASGSTTNILSPVSECNNITLYNNIINGGLYGMVIMGDTAGNQISGWNVINNTIKNSGNYGMYGWGTTSANISGNDISRIGRSNLLNFYAIYFTNDNLGLKIQNNKIHDISNANLNASFDFYGIYIDNSQAQSSIPSTKNLVINNLLYNLNGAGNHWYFYNYNSGYTGYYHNSVCTGSYNNTATGTTIGYFHDINNGYVYFRNNCIYINRKTSNIKSIYYVYHGPLKLDANYNNLFINGDGYNYVGYYIPVYYNTVFAWSNAAAKDYNATSINPYYVSPSTGNLKPQSTSLDNTGDNEGVTTDILGNVRSTSTPDVGAFEYSVATCSGAPLAGKAVADLINACPNGLINLTVDSASMATGISIQWQSKPSSAGSWSPISGSTPINYYSYFNATMPSVATDFRAAITCSGNTVYSLPVSVGLNPSYYCYCSPYTNDSLHNSNNLSNIITNVNITGTNLNNTTGNGFYAAGYSRNSPSVYTNTANIAKLNPYTINVTFGGPNYLAGVWVDYNKNYIFDSSEYFVLTTNGTIASGSFTVPATSTIGPTGIRVRAYFTTAPNGNDACVKNTAQETEDYVVQIWYPLSINIENINAINSGNRNKLIWNTLSEDYGDMFELERSVDGNVFETITKVSSRGFGSEYTYWDENPANGMNFYRLKLVSLNGDITYTKVVNAFVKSMNAFEVKMFPNPTVNVLNIVVNGESIANSVVSITDLTGKLIRKVSMQEHNTQIDIADLTPGIYFFQYNDDLHKKTVKVIKQ